jgi:hypothetical protein
MKFVYQGPVDSKGIRTVVVPGGERKTKNLVFHKVKAGGVIDVGTDEVAKQHCLTKTMSSGERLFKRYAKRS